MPMKGYSEFPKAPALLESHHPTFWCHIQDTHWREVLPLCRDTVGVFCSPSRMDHSLESLTPLQRYSRCILQPKSDGPQGIRLLSLTPLQRCSRCILQPQSDGPLGIRLESLTPLQRCSWCILQPQSDGLQGTRLESLTPLQRCSRWILQPQ